MKPDRLKLRAAVLAMAVLMMANVLSAFKAKTMYSDIWQQLGISKPKATKNISASFMNGYLSLYGVRNIKAIVTGDRVALANDLMGYAKDYINSEQFASEYAVIRMQAMPDTISIKRKTREEIRTEKIIETENSIRETENYVRKNPSMASAMNDVLHMLKSNLEEYKSQQSALLKLACQAEEYRQQDAEKDKKDRLKQWWLQYPVDAKRFVVGRLAVFIALAKTVDFDAEVKSSGKKLVFVNPNYEAKSAEWKQIYRAGNEVIKAAVDFSKGWMLELNKSCEL